MLSASPSARRSDSSFFRRRKGKPFKMQNESNQRSIRVDEGNSEQKRYSRSGRDRARSSLTVLQATLRKLASIEFAKIAGVAASKLGRLVQQRVDAKVTVKIGSTLVSIFINTSRQ
jgi:hypothetical protein